MFYAVKKQLLTGQINTNALKMVIKLNNIHKY